MQIGLTGATGFIGRRVVEQALQRGHEITAFSRHPERRIAGCTMRAFSLESPPDLTGCEAVVHLAGEPVAGLWTARKRRAIRESRVQGTRRLVDALLALREPPEVLVSSSGVGIYEPHAELELNEEAALGSNFLASTARAWEEEACRAESAMRVVRLRTAQVFGRKGGALAALAPLFRYGLGGVLGDGQQWVPWIHLEDQVRLILFAVENADVRGAVNATAPWPVRNRELTKTLAEVLHRPAWWRVPAFVLRGVLGGFAAELLDSKRVVPAAATAWGFPFRFPELKPALRDLLG